MNTEKSEKNCGKPLEKRVPKVKSSIRGLWTYLIAILILSAILVLSSCGGYVKPTASCEKVLTESSKPHCKVKAEIGRVFEL